MASITIKDVPEDLHRELKERAKRHRRSLNSEVIACLEAIVEQPMEDPEEWIHRARELRERVGGYLTQERLDEMIEEGRRH